MRKVLVSIFFICFILTGLAAESIVGSWEVVDQLKNVPRIPVLGDFELSKFVFDGKSHPVKNFSFNADGTATIKLADDSIIPAFFQAEHGKVYLQMKGGKDTTLYYHPVIEDTFVLLLGTWRFPSQQYLEMIFILKKSN